MRGHAALVNDCSCRARDHRFERSIRRRPPAENDVLSFPRFPHSTWLTLKLRAAEQGQQVDRTIFVVLEPIQSGSEVDNASGSTYSRLKSLVYMNRGKYMDGSQPRNP